MDLLALNIQRPSAISSAIYGNFSGPKQQEIVAAKGSVLELLRPDDTGRVLTVCSTPTFSNIRSIASFRQAGANRDMVVIGSDSGKISILEYVSASNSWKLLHCEVFGKTGCRRIVPGQYVATDPKGRAILIAAVEKQKFVYVMNRDSNNKMTISSPLEAHKSETILFSVCGVDVGFDNPIFAMIELEYTEADQDPSGEVLQEIEKKLSFYELDLGLNHVVRKWSEPISRTANFLLSVPGGDVWPSGVLICGENWISYKNQGHVEIRTALPRRHDIPPERGVLITSGTVHKQKDLFFFLLQSEYGDLYKVNLDLDPNDSKIVQNVVVTVFDTISPANSLCITKTGLLFAASEFGNHALFQFQGIGDPNAVRSERIMDDKLNEELGDDSLSAARVAPLFKASRKLQNLLMTDDVNSLAPITDMLVADLTGEESQQIYSLCGRGNRSSLRILKHGVSVVEMAVSELPGRPTAVWTLKKSQEEEYHSLIVVSFSNATLVLSIGETVEEISDSGLLTTGPTLQVALLADNATIQVHSTGIRHIRPDQRISEWKTPGKRIIQLAAVNSRQVAVALSGGELIYFELDSAGQLIEMGSIDLGKEISSLDLGVVPPGRVRSMFLAVGCWDDSVQLLTLDPADVLGKGPAFAVESRPTALCLVEMAKDSNPADAVGTAGTVIGGFVGSVNSSSSQPTSLYLNIGLEKGVLLRVAVDPITGDFSDARQKFLGPRAIKLCRVTIQNASSVMALTSRAWLMYNYQHRYHQDPLSYSQLEHVSDFSSEACPGGIVAVAENTLRILAVDNLGAMYNQTGVPLRYTPRKICRVVLPAQQQQQQSPGIALVAVVEADHNEYNEQQRVQLQAQYAAALGGDAMDTGAGAGAAGAASSAQENTEGSARGEAAVEEEEEEEEEEGTTVTIRGPVPGADGVWGSCVRLVDVGTAETKCILELSDNEAAISVCCCCFSAAQDPIEPFVVVGTVQNLVLHPKRWTACFIHVYRVTRLTGAASASASASSTSAMGPTVANTDGQLRLDLVHKTEVESIPLAMVGFQGRLLVGLGRCLRLYDLGKRKLLKKCENKSLPSCIVKLQCSGDRIFVGDIMESVQFVKYRQRDHALIVFADDCAPRFITSLTVLDHNTVGCVDKFGNVFTLRLPDDASDEAEAASSSNALWDHGLLNGAANKLDLLTHFYLGEAATAVQCTVLKPHGKMVMLVGTITGGLYAFAPAKTKEEVTFFQHLEMYMRQEYNSLCQRDHLSFRSYFQPVKRTIDVDLCEEFSALPFVKQRDFAEEVDRSPAEIMKKLEELRDFM